MSDKIVIFFIFSSALISMLISLGQIVQKDKSIVDYIFSISFAGLAVWFLQLSLYSTGIFKDYYISYFVQAWAIPFSLITPPLMSLRYRWIISTKLTFKKRYLIPFLPALISVVILLLPLFIVEFRYMNDFAFYSNLLSKEFTELPLYFRTVYSMFAISNLYLIFLMLPGLVSTLPHILKKTRGGVPNVPRAGFIFGSLITLSNIVAVTGYLFSMEILKLSVIIANFSMCSVYLVTQRHPDYNRLLKSHARKHQYERSIIKGLDLNVIIDRLYELMEEEKAFTDEELTLAELSKELSISSHQLSEILNGRIKKNFNTFINEYRIKEAKKLLIEDPDRTILSVGIAAGFNSNSTFNTVFTRSEGISPGKFRKQSLKT